MWFGDHQRAYLVSTRLHVSSKREVVTSNNLKELSTLDEVVSFLNKRCRLLGKSCLSNEFQPTSKIKTISFASAIEPHCHYCSSTHFIHQCDALSKLSIKERINDSEKKNLCVNFFSKDHNTASCKSKFPRKHSYKRHQSLVYIYESNSANAAVASKVSIVMHVSPRDNINQKLLSTVCIPVVDCLGNWHTCRAVFDSGSQSNFITSRNYTRFNLHNISTQSMILGIGHAVNVNHRADYVRFMEEYEKLAHMKLISELEIKRNFQNYYVVHHAVVKAFSSITKTRVAPDCHLTISRR